MAVYKRTYRGYSGDITPAWSRFLIIFRYSRRNLFRSKLMTGFFVLCFFAPVLALLGIYANDHLGVLLGGPIGGAKLIKTDGGQFFLNFLNVQTAFAFILTAFIGPGLVSPDLANGALTVYLCRPISRVEYILGKLSVLAIILSWITWIPALVLFFVQASLSGWDWMMQNLWIATGCFIASWIWILSTYLLALALSAWVKWRIAAGACCWVSYSSAPVLLSPSTGSCKRNKATCSISQSSSTSFGKISFMIPATEPCPFPKLGSVFSPSPPAVSTCS